MSLIHIDRNPAPSKLRWFGLLLGIFLLLVGGILRWRWNLPTAGLALWIFAAVIVPAYYLLPAMQKPLYLGWMYATLPMGLAVSYVVLAVIYFGVLMPIGLLVRLTSGDPLRRRLEPAAATYWVPHQPPANQQRYFRQF
jgi:hypothetical protein